MRYRARTFQNQITLLGDGCVFESSIVLSQLNDESDSKTVGSSSCNCNCSRIKFGFGAKTEQVTAALWARWVKKVRYTRSQKIYTRKIIKSWGKTNIANRRQNNIPLIASQWLLRSFRTVRLFDSGLARHMYTHWFSEPAVMYFPSWLQWIEINKVVDKLWIWTKLWQHSSYHFTASISSENE